MSGPKVVRIVSREEIEAACRTHLRDVVRAAESLARVADRLGLLNTVSAGELAARRALMERLIREERWMEVQKQGPAIVAFLKREQASIEAAAVAEAAAARTRARRAREAARTLVAALETKGAEVPGALRAAARGALEPEAARGAVESALNGLAAQHGSPAGQEDAALASRLSAADSTPGRGTATSLEAWIEASCAKNDKSVERMESALAELEAIVGEAGAAPFVARFELLTAQRDPGTPALLADSLVLEMGAAVTAHRAAAAARSRLDAALSGLEAISSGGAIAVAEALRVEAAGEDAAALPALAERAETALAAQSAALAADARRRALLAGLAELGYEVRPSMSTALVELGRIVVRRPGNADYGVELAAPGAAERVQVRLVGSARPAAPRDARRDRDAETTWCGDVDRLRSLIGEAGGELVVERALGAGVEPVKTVGMEATTEAGYVEAAPAAAGRVAS